MWLLRSVSGDLPSSQKSVSEWTAALNWANAATVALRWSLLLFMNSRSARTCVAAGRSAVTTCLNTAPYTSRATRTETTEPDPTKVTFGLCDTRTVSFAARIERPEPGEVILADAAGVVLVRLGAHRRGMAAIVLATAIRTLLVAEAMRGGPDDDLAAMSLALADGQATVEAGTRTPA